MLPSLPPGTFIRDLKVRGPPGHELEPLKLNQNNLFLILSWLSWVFVLVTESWLTLKTESLKEMSLSYHNSPTPPHSSLTLKKNWFYQLALGGSCLSTRLGGGFTSLWPKKYFFLSEHQLRTTKSRVWRSSLSQRRANALMLVYTINTISWLGVTLPQYFWKMRKPLISSAPGNTPLSIKGIFYWFEGGKIVLCIRL